MADEIDRSIGADAKRFRWLLDGNGYFMEEEMLCSPHSHTEEDKDKARIAIDRQMQYEGLL